MRGTGDGSVDRSRRFRGHGGPHGGHRQESVDHLGGLSLAERHRLGVLESAVGHELGDVVARAGHSSASFRLSSAVASSPPCGIRNDQTARRPPHQVQCACRARLTAACRRRGGILSSGTDSVSVPIRLIRRVVFLRR